MSACVRRGSGDTPRGATVFTASDEVVDGALAVVPAMNHLAVGEAQRNVSELHQQPIPGAIGFVTRSTPVWCARLSTSITRRSPTSRSTYPTSATWCWVVTVMFVARSEFSAESQMTTKTPPGHRRGVRAIAGRPNRCRVEHRGRIACSATLSHPKWSRCCALRPDVYPCVTADCSPHVLGRSGRIHDLALATPEC